MIYFQKYYAEKAAMLPASLHHPWGAYAQDTTILWYKNANVCDFQKENHTLGYGFKNLYKIYSLASYGFLFFVISISGKAMVKRGGGGWASETEAEKRLKRRPQAGGK